MSGTIINGDTNIGINSYIGYNCLISSCTIGNYTSIGNNVNIGHGEHQIDDISTNVLFDKNKNKLTELPLIIEDDVWIGTGAIILRGVKIGRGAVIGAGAVVTKDVPRYTVVVGVPAYVLKCRLSEHQIAAIERTQWWNKDIKEATKIVENLRELL